jgi:plastocyanin
MKSKIVIYALLLLTAMAVNSCSKSNDYSSGGTGSPGANEVWMQNTTFVPSQRTVSVGTTITWTNKDNADHDVASTTGVFSSPTMGKNATFSYTFNTAGTFNYVCNFHPGMTGKIIVQ